MFKNKINFWGNGFFPRGGGVLVGISTLFILTVVFFWGNGFGIRTKDYWSVLLSGLVMIGGGIWDDKKKLAPIYQLGYQILAVMVLISAGDLINHLRLPGVGTVEFFGEMKIVLTLVWFLVALNAFNWFDGLNGLAGGSALLALAAFFWISLFSVAPQSDVAAMIVVLATTVTIFLFFNLAGRVQLGSAGSGFVGLLLALFAVYLGGKVAAVAFVLALPIMDFIWVCFLRIKKGLKPWRGGDRRHLHYFLIDKGWSEGRVVDFFYLINFILGILAFGIQGLLDGSSFLFLVTVFILVTGIRRGVLGRIGS